MARSIYLGAVFLLLATDFGALTDSAQAAAAHRKSKGTKLVKMAAGTIDLLDVQEIDQSSPLKAIKSFALSNQKKRIKCDVLIVGGGVGAVAAAIKLSAEHAHLKVCLTEETNWLGGQMTAQGVCALDENYLIETSGACRNYQTFRENVRSIYKQFELSEAGKAQQYLNPGNCWVTYLAFEPKFALKVIETALDRATNSGALEIFLRTKVLAVESQDNPKASIKNVVAVNLDSGGLIEFEPRITLDATELGDLLPLAGIPYRVGSDSRADTGEAHAPEKGDRENVQDFVYPFVVDFKPGTNNTIEKPANFDKFNDAGKFSLDGYKMFEESVLVEEGNRTVPPFWTYRRLIARENFADPLYPFDVAMINWDSNDLRGYNIIDQQTRTEAERLALAKSLSLGFLYWLQTKAPRDEGGQGYPELQLRTDVLGSSDGLSKYPYIREARRVIAKRTIVENDIVSSANHGARAKHCQDSLGIGLYPVDIHGMQEVPGAGQATRPFQIPMSALIPEHGGQLLPACKNIGVTHITNGAYRLHPVEWAIGEAQAQVAAHCLKHHISPARALADEHNLRMIQRALIEGGSPLVWFDDVPTSDPNFAAIQYTTLTGLLVSDDQNLHFNPDQPTSVKEAAESLARLCKWRVEPRANNDTTDGAGTIAPRVDQSPPDALTLARKNGYLQADSGADETSVESRMLTVDEFRAIARKADIPITRRQSAADPVKLGSDGGGKATISSTDVSRSQWARWLYDAEVTREKQD